MHTMQFTCVSEEAKATADSSRLIPPYNEDAQRPHDVYALHDIIPEAEFNAIPVNAFKNANDMKDRYALLPWSRSDWVKLQLRLIYSAPKPDKRDLYVCYPSSHSATLIPFSLVASQEDRILCLNNDGVLQKLAKRRRQGRATA